MAEAYGVGGSIRFIVFLWDGTEALTGKTVSLSVRQEGDSAFWNGSAFSGTYGTVSMIEQFTDEATATNAHIEGQYVYDLDMSSLIDADQYTWSIKYSEDAYLTYFKGAFETIFGLTTARRLVAVGC